MNIRFKQPQRYRAVLLDGQDARAQFLESLLADRGRAVVARYGAVAEATTLRRLPESELIIVFCAEASPRELSALSSLSDEGARAVVAITENDDPIAIERLITAGATSVLCVGPSADRLGVAISSAIAMQQRLERLQQQADAAERRLEDRKLVERAKGILMQQRGLPEPEAFRALQHASMQRNEPLTDVARSIIAAKELLG